MIWGANVLGPWDSDSRTLRKDKLVQSQTAALGQHGTYSWSRAEGHSSVGSSNVYKGPGRKYLRLCRPHSFCCYYSTLVPKQPQGIHKRMSVAGFQ